ncbi:MAG: hypothetical protein MUF39_06045 [Cyclobacteriaceae bacterium]|nr:hypothetical protein [Cyclobacteriaceae bacterium]
MSIFYSLRRTDRKAIVRKYISLKLLLVIVFQISWPSTALALTGGPSQPEVQSFEPVDVSNMVDLFSGDFSYNIPLLDVDGYPMNISYHSGITMDQEASSVGLGWNINPGVINRNMRGIPDDFNGDEIEKEQNIKKNQTIGISCGFSGELFGFDDAQITARFGIRYNNYTGVGIEQSWNLAVSASNKFGGSGAVSLGITSSSEDGLSLAPSISLSQTSGKSERASRLGVSIGASYNSRGGLTALTIKPDISQNLGVKNKANGFMTSASFPGGGSTFNFGQQTYSPYIDFPMQNLSVTGNLKLGLEATGFVANIAPTGYYMEQGQLTKTLKSRAYGYLHLQNGQKSTSAMMDFNREKDGSFNRSTYNLPLTNLTYDIYSVSGQGTGGSYRLFRSDVGHVYDIASYSTSDGYSGSVEAGLGNIFKAGTDIVVNSAYSNSGDWVDSKAYENYSFQGNDQSDYEAAYFKEANEKSINSDPGFLTRYGGYKACRFELDDEIPFDTKTSGKIITSQGQTLEANTESKRKKRDKKNQSIATLTNREVYEGMGLFGGSAGSGMQNQYISSNIWKFAHHIGQITSLNTDGKRYVYALPVYNKQQEEVTFAVGKPVGGGSARPKANGLVTYQPGQDNTVDNKMGLDNYYSNTKMPPFAHSYLLTAVLSPDYVDLTGNGPTDDDLGNYTLFEYTEVPNYNWRSPIPNNKAKFNEGLKSDPNDDKGSYVYGVKQLYYLSKVIGKNHEASLTYSDRVDGLGVNTKNGGASATNKQKKLESIVLKVKGSQDIVKTVFFEYNNGSAQEPMLCPGIDNAPQGQGKLTLKSIHFNHRSSKKGNYNAYEFKYVTKNPNYDAQTYDRWGNYKSANPSGAGTAVDFEYFPYTNQDQTAQVRNEDASAWSLEEIKLPSGGKIHINYESDDYAYVQDMQATQMYLYNAPPSNQVSPALPQGNLPASGIQKWLDNYPFVVKIPNEAPLGVKIQDLIPETGLIYFKSLVRLTGSAATSHVFDYVPGYAEVDLMATHTKTFSVNSDRYASFVFKSVNLDENNSSPFAGPPLNISNTTMLNPIVKAALQFGRLNASRIVWNQPNASASMNEQVMKALVNSSFFTTIKQAVQGPNASLYKDDKCSHVDLTKSWIKLKNITGKKYGGGSRVKSIILNDDFSTMTGVEASSEYGQVYSYTTKDRKNNVISSGVASYEPMIGGEENCLKTPFFTQTKKLLVPDDEHYTEAPFGESFYPSASVGYSCVRVANYYPDPASLPPPMTNATIDNHKTGYVDHEFFTAKDFPTITDRTELEAIECKDDPFELATLFKLNSENHMTASQGFYVELNDMHGKQKAVKTYNNADQLISSIEYFYKSENYGGKGGKRLKNNVTALTPNGAVTTGEVGVYFDAVADLREQSTESQSNETNLNFDTFYAFVLVATLVPIPTYTSDKTQFRSATMTKVVQRFGILDKTIAKKDGSTVTTSNLAYDSETGDVLLTQVINDYNDPIYNFRYPAYWYYKQMGSAYKNIDYALRVNGFINGNATIESKQNLFSEGDELIVATIPATATSPVNYYKAWVTKSKSNLLELRDINGSGATFNGDYILKVVRSGYRNMQTMDMANISTLVNPLGGIRSNIYQRMINSSAIEYDQNWKVNCDCNTPLYSSNPYAVGTKGNWRPIRNYAYLTDRVQTNNENNSNIRQDGTFMAYQPFI